MITMDLMSGYGRVDEQVAVQEAAAAGLRGMEHLILELSRTGTSDSERSTPPAQELLLQQQKPQVDCREITDVTVSKFKKVISILNRSGHARFRRGPVVAQSQGPAASEPAPVRSLAAAASRPMTLDFTEVASGYGKDAGFIVSGLSAASSSFLSYATGDGSVSNGRGGGSSTSPAASTAPPAACCHCSKRRKHRAKRTIRVPAISSKVADIPADEFSWRKYGQKPIKGSPYPRGYYKCSTVRGCPARKHVERDPHEASMLIVTYEGEHRHSHAGPDAPPPAPASQP
ncbi:hypothetical protein GUJ93_ZPchr0004g40251 [Zizania palustris]|uniref:WRKY transcription factor WRKY51 n=1 Tax=Zizania palustris TaxID=103762 RepID=A0A8J5S4T8_ZIZPA|nr:hypothetical protein GUJ93_ZPchr0004g40251 [Zizania palustris]